MTTADQRAEMIRSLREFTRVLARAASAWQNPLTLAIARQHHLGVQVALEQRSTPVHLGIELMVEPRQVLVHPALADGDDRGRDGGDETSGEPDP